MPAAAQITDTGHALTRLERLGPERRMIRRVIEALAPARVEIANETADRIELEVDGAGWMLARISLGREALERLVDDPLREVKLSYLVRDILRSAPKCARWAYPRAKRLKS